MARKTVSPVFTLTMPVQLAIAVKVAADMEMVTIAEWLRQAAKARCAAQGVNPAELCDAG
jgi:hypothetical protein